MALVTAQMGAAAVVAILAAMFLEPQRTVELTPYSVGGLTDLATVGSVAAFFVTFYVIRRYEVSVVSSFIFLQPILGVLLGALLLGEVVTANIVLSLVLTVAGLAIVNRDHGARFARRARGEKVTPGRHCLPGVLDFGVSWVEGEEGEPLQYS